MAIFEFNNNQFYIDNRLKFQLDNKIIPDLAKADKDNVFIVDGRERIGKSKFSDIIGAYAATKLNSKYDISCICMTPEEFKDRIMKAKKNEVVIYDEAHRGMGSRRALSEVNKVLVDLMMEMGQKNLFVIIVLPTFFMLDRYQALFRTKGLFHIYERKGKRGFWVYFNEKYKKFLYINGKKMFNYNCIKWPKFRGRFYNQYAVDEATYRRKKAKSFKEKPREIVSKEALIQRNMLIKLIYDRFKLKQKDMSDLFKEKGLNLTRSAISKIITANSSGESRESNQKRAESGGNSGFNVNVKSESI